MKFSILGLQNVAIGYVSVWATAPVLAYGTGYRVLAVVAVLGWAMLELFRKHGIFAKPTMSTILVGVFFTYSLLVEFVTEINYSGLLQTYIFLFFVLIYESRKSRLSSLQPVFWILVASLPVWLYSTYLAFDSIDPHIARLIVRSSDIAEELAEQGLGGYGLVYSMVLLLPLLVVMVFRYREFGLMIPRLSSSIARPIIIGVLVLNVILGAAVIFRAGYTIAVVLALLSVVIALVVRRRSIDHLLLVGIVGSAVFATAMINLPTLLQQLAPLVDGTAYAPKVADMILSLELDTAHGTVEGRTAKYTASFAAFLGSPLIGSLTGDVIGGHSAILDRLGRYGLVFGGIYAYLYFSSLINLMRERSYPINIVFATAFAAILLAVFNTVPGLFGAILFILVPVGCAMNMSTSSNQLVRVVRV